MTIMVSEDDRRSMKNMIVEMTNCLERIAAEQDQMKEIAADAESKFNIKKKIVKRMAKTMYKSNYSDLQKETEHFELLYEAVVEGKVLED